MLVVTLFVLSGCATLLLGNDRAAYERIEKATGYFKYPKSVRIVSGEMLGPMK